MRAGTAGRATRPARPRRHWHPVCSPPPRPGQVVFVVFVVSELTPFVRRPAAVRAFARPPARARARFVPRSRLETLAMTKWLMRLFGAAVALTLLPAAVPSARAADTVKVGVLHSLSGTMAISEASLRDV